MAFEHAVNLGMMNLPAEMLLQGFVQGRHDDHSGARRLLDPRTQKALFLFKGHRLPTPPSVQSFVLQARVADFRLNAADTRRTQADGGGRLFPCKTEDGGQQNGLGRAHLANGLGGTE
jgi:hypothetical protein